MGTFQSSDQLVEVLGGFFRHLLTHPEIGPKLVASHLILRFNYKEPDASLTVDLSGSQPVVSGNSGKLAQGAVEGEAPRAPEIEMSMKADVAHRFWLGQVNLVVALARREIIAKGPIPKILKLLPIIKPAFQLYPEYIKGKGL